MIKVLTSKEVAQILQVSMPTARYIMKSKGFPLIKVGSHFRVEENAFINWMQNRKN